MTSDVSDHCPIFLISNEQRGNYDNKRLKVNKTLKK